MKTSIKLTLTEDQFKRLKLYTLLGDIIAEAVSERSESENKEHIELHQLLDKAAYEAKLKGSGKQDDFYYYGQEIEEEMMRILETYDAYVESGRKTKEMEELESSLKRGGFF